MCYPALFMCYPLCYPALFEENSDEVKLCFPQPKRGRPRNSDPLMIPPFMNYTFVQIADIYTNRLSSTQQNELSFQSFTTAYQISFQY